MADKAPLVIDAGQVRQTAAGDVIVCPGLTNSALTSGRVVLAGASGVLADDADLTFDGVTLSTLVVSVPTTTTALSGVLKIGDVAFHNYESSGSNGKNLFLGELAGNFTLNHAGNVTQSSRNVGIGYNALHDITTGYHNIAIGFGAANNVTTGYENFAFGFNALSVCTDGYENLAIGSQALQLLTSGMGNVALGRAAGTVVTIGSYDVFIGGNSGASCTEGDSNIGIGFSALQNLTVGDSNVAIGRSALGLATTQDYNTAVGHVAGYSSTGTENTFIGYGAGYYNVGSHGVFVGRGAGLWETGSSKLFIDNANRGSEANDRILALVYGVFAATAVAQDLTFNAQVGINIPPTAWLTLRAGAAAAGTAPLKLTSGALNTTPEVCAIECLTDKLHFVITTGAARKEIALTEGLTSGKIPIATTNGRLTDGSAPLVGTKIYYVSDSSGGAVDRKLTFIDGILTSET